MMVQWVKIQHCHSCGVGHSFGLDLIPGSGTSLCCGGNLKKKKKKRFLHVFSKPNSSFLFRTEKMFHYLDVHQFICLSPTEWQLGWFGLSMGVSC